MDDTAKIVVSGYYGFDNIGDEAVLFAIISSLKEYIPNVVITVLSNNPEKTKRLYQVEAVNRWHFSSVSKVIKQSDMLISGGGSLLQDVTSSKTIPYYLGIIKIAQFYKKKVVFYSQGVGPINKAVNKWLIKKIVNKVDHIFVRETMSKETLTALGIKAPISVATDPVLGICLDKNLSDSIKASFQGEKTVGVYLRPWHHQEQIISSLVPNLKSMMQKGYTVYFLPMYYDQDIDIAKEVNERLGAKGRIINKKLTIEETLAYTASFDFIIGMRLHSLIMAAAVGTPVLALSYDPKVKSFADEMQIRYCLNVEKITKDSIEEKIEELTGTLDLERQRIKLVYNQKIQETYSPVIYIKECLSRRNS